MLQIPITPIGPKWTVFSTRRESTPIFNDLEKLEIRTVGVARALNVNDLWRLRGAGWRIDVVWDEPTPAEVAAELADADPTNPENLAIPPAGTAGLWDNPAGYVIYALLQSGAVVIKRVLVAEPSRRKGLGTALIRQAIKYAVDCNAKEVSCQVPESNQELCELLRSCLFRVPQRLDVAYPFHQVTRSLSLRVPGDC